MQSLIWFFIKSNSTGKSLEQGRRSPQSVNQGSNSNTSNNNNGRRASLNQASTSAPPSRGTGRVRGPDDEDDDEDGPPFNCPKSDGLYADPSNCKRFYLCGAWHAYSQACPPSLYFDDKLKFCTFKTSALVCGPVEEDPEERASTNQEKLTVCDKQRCQLPNCFCSDEGTSIPGKQLLWVV